jgi:TPP-dependent pyruvate/acetoin dehydrogenase alpha subunit
MTSKQTYSKATLLGFYRDMLLIRILEERIGYLFLEGVISGTLHQCLGQEAVAVGVCSALNKDDVITSGHRPHGHAIAKGVDLTAFMLELFGKTGGCCGGRGGSMHVGDLSVGMIPSIAIVGANTPVATGAGLTFKLKREARVAVCFTGDGGVAEGAFHEAVNIAAVWNLPVIYVIENNRYAASTHYSKNSKLKHLSDLAAAYGIPGVLIDGNDVLKVYETASDAIDRARNGGGPTILEAMTYRLTGHNRGVLPSSIVGQICIDIFRYNSLPANLAHQFRRLKNGSKCFCEKELRTSDQQ